MLLAEADGGRGLWKDPSGAEESTWWRYHRGGGEALGDILGVAYAKERGRREQAEKTLYKWGKEKAMAHVQNQA